MLKLDVEEVKKKLKTEIANIETMVDDYLVKNVEGYCSYSQKEYIIMLLKKLERSVTGLEKKDIR